MNIGNNSPSLTINPMWGGRFAGGEAKAMVRINASISFDQRLYVQDLRASKAHCAMLVAQGIIQPTDGNIILHGLDQIAQEIATGQFVFKEEFEDIHMNVEARLAELVGPAVAGHLHTARSRNDQVVTDFRLWIRDAIDEIDTAGYCLQLALLEQAERHASTVMPGFTHLQAAQPITFGHHLLAYVEMIKRDRDRLANVRQRLNECPLGACALAGTSFPLDRHRVAAELGFDRPCVNSIDAVSDRDFALEFLFSSVVCAMHLSRLAEELVLWTSIPFSFVSLSDAFTTGSSMMPQKRNPDAAELVRAKTGRMIGSMHTLLVVMKGLPLAYAKDMQEDKEPVFDAADTLSLSLKVMTGMISELQVNIDVMRTACEKGYITATDLADWLVQALRIPFRRAHYITGKIVKIAEEHHCTLAMLPLEHMQAIEPRITADIYNVLETEKAVTTRTSFGGTAPINVLSEIAKIKHHIRSRSIREQENT